MLRFKQFDQNEAIVEAMSLFWKKGYSATSLSDLTEHLEIGKGSFYNTFQGKRELFERALAVYRKSSTENLEALLNSEQDVKIGIRKLFNLGIEGLMDDKDKKGCFLANTCAELGNSDEEIRKIIIEDNAQSTLSFQIIY